MKAVVVGAGIAGSSVVRALERHGVRPVLIGREWADSMAALALLRRAWHKGEELHLFDRSLDLYQSWGVRMVFGAYVTSYRRPGVQPAWQEDWRAIDPREPLRTPQRYGTATRVPEGVWIDGDLLKADAVFWCGGAGMDGTEVSYGTTWVHDRTPAAKRIGLSIHHMAPYKTLGAGAFGNGAVRLGSSSAATEAKAIQQADKMLTAAQEWGLITTRSGWKAVTGRRCKGTVQRDEGIHHVFAGFHRTGYALVPALAEKFVTERMSRRS